jgi:transposase
MLAVEHGLAVRGAHLRRIELITGETRRRRWTVEEKARILAESFRPGARVSEVALRHGVNRGLLWTWRRQVRKHEAEAEPAFVPIRIAADLTAPQSSAAVELNQPSASPAQPAPVDVQVASPAGSIDIEMGDVRVRVIGAVDTSALRTVLSHLGRVR